MSWRMNWSHGKGGSTTRSAGTRLDINFEVQQQGLGDLAPFRGANDRGACGVSTRGGRANPPTQAPLRGAPPKPSPAFRPGLMRAFAPACGTVTRQIPGGAVPCTGALLRPPQRRADLMPMVAPYYSADMVRKLPDDGNRYETVRGELLVTPAPRAWHQELVGRCYESLRAYVRTQAVGHVLLSPADISWGPDTLVQPDVFVVNRAQARTWEWRHMTALLLAVEVLSPASARADRFSKRRLYQDVGVATYWIVDPDAQMVEIWTPGDVTPAVPAGTLVWHPAGATAPFEINLRELFREL